MKNNDLERVIFNLENIVIGYLGADRDLNETAVADLLRQHGTSPVVHLALVAALTQADADYRLVVVENTNKHPGGVPKLGAKLSQMDRANAVRNFVEQAEAEGGGTEAAVADAATHFSLSRSSIFKLLRLSRLLDPCPRGAVYPLDCIPH